MKRKPSGVVTLLAFCTAILLVSTFANAIPAHSPFPQCYDFTFPPNSGKNAELQHPCMAPAKIGRIIEGHNFIWGESIGWVNLRTTHADLKIGSNILAGWVWLENCGWVCLGEGRPLEGNHYSNRSAHDWGVNNDRHGQLSGLAWSEVTGWINFHTGHSRVYLDESGQFYGYAWGENVGWMHFGPGRIVQYLAKADPGPWREIGEESRSRFASGPDDSEMSSGSIPISGLNITHERYNKDSDSVCSLKLGKNDSCAHIRCCDTPVHIASLAKLSPIRAPPLIV